MGDHIDSVYGRVSWICSQRISQVVGLAIPCLFCTRIENEHFYYNDSICNNHKKNVSCLAFCHAHKKLSDMRNLCENCLLSFATKKEADCHNCKSLLGILQKDIELFLDEEHQDHLSLPSVTKDVLKSNDNRCACCGEPLKVKSYDPKWKSCYLSPFNPAPSPRAPVNRNFDFSPHIKCSSFKLNPNLKESDSEEYKSKTMAVSTVGGHVKAGSLPLLIDAEEPKTPKFFGGQVRMNRKSLMSLYMELDEERSLSAEAANNAMAMITRLQTEKAAVQMEALQYQRMMNEQAQFDQEALQEMYNMMVKTEEELQGLQAELEAYRQKYGFLKDFNFQKQSIKTGDRNSVTKLLSYSFNGRTECGTPTFLRNQPPKLQNLEQNDSDMEEEETGNGSNIFTIESGDEDTDLSDEEGSNR
ncbi:Detected protein of unknown function [Hibiscus syriacus]|uniref:GTD-binding domain-containing protein n=1 Tax=Hibiscus syriacus TaxID=106335 RepID=A0A6A3AUJ4_HIBSY|nr:Detected protein of unknown function [Hibiscus syriacus]